MRRSFSAAAEALSFTQPAVSQHVARLETRPRHPAARPRVARRGAHAGRRGAAPSRRGDPQRRAPRGGRGARALRRGAARSCASAPSSPPPRALIPEAFRLVRAEHPGVDLQAQAIEPDPGVRKVATGGLEAAMVIESLFLPPPETPGVELRHVFDDLMLVVLPEGHPLALRPSMPLEELADEPWLLGDVAGTCPDSNIVLRACQEAGFTPQVEFSSEDYSAGPGHGRRRHGRRADPFDGHRDHAPRRRRPPDPRPGADAPHPRRGPPRRGQPRRRVAGRGAPRRGPAARARGCGWSTPRRCVLLEVLPALVAGVLYARRAQTLAREGKPVPTWRQLCFAAGLLLAPRASSRSAASPASTSPRTWPSTCCSATSPRCCIVLGLTGPVLAAGPAAPRRSAGCAHSPTRSRRSRCGRRNLALWHVAALHEAAVDHDAVHALQHVMFVALGRQRLDAALRPAAQAGVVRQPRQARLHRRRAAAPARVLGNVLLWTGHPLYDVYDASDPLADQDAGRPRS